MVQIYKQKSKGVKRLYAFQKQLYPTIVDAILNLMAFHAFKMGFTWDEDVSYTVNTQAIVINRV